MFIVSLIIILFCKKLPGSFVILFAVAAIERRDILYRAFNRAARLSVVGDSACKRAGRRVFYLFPFRAAIVDSCEAAVVGENDATVTVVPCIRFVAMQYGELNTVSPTLILDSSFCISIYISPLEISLLP